MFNTSYVPCISKPTHHEFVIYFPFLLFFFFWFPFVFVFVLSVFYSLFLFFVMFFFPLKLSYQGCCVHWLVFGITGCDFRDI